MAIQTSKRVCVVGLGRVGLTLATTLANIGFQVAGIDKNRDTVARLREGLPPFFERGLESALQRCLDRTLTIQDRITTDGYDACIICVGTPLDPASGRAHLEPLIAASEEVGQALHPGSLVIVRSTVPVGATRGVVQPALRRHQDEFSLATCPERTVEGQALTELRQLPQVIGGLDQESVDRAVQLFSHVTATTVRVASVEAAEMTKLIDNSYRDLNFAFANEVALMAETLGLDGSEVIRSANLGYPRNNIPGPGFVGGTCLSKDPHILIESAAAAGSQFKLASVARDVNASLPGYMVEKLQRSLKSAGKRLQDSKVLVAGVAFKGRPDNDDVRDSPALALIQCLSGGNGHGPAVFGHDFVVPEAVMRGYDIQPCSLEEGFRDADAVIFANNHPAYHQLNIARLASLMNHPAVIADAWHIFDREDIAALDGIIYGGLGVG
ncbi:MAG: nucleotide sugar dehydrogenase [Dehalococcoidia bacterium]